MLLAIIVIIIIPSEPLNFSCEALETMETSTRGRVIGKKREREREKLKIERRIKGTEERQRI